MWIVRSRAWIPSAVSDVPNLFPATELEGRDPGSQKSELVGRCSRTPRRGPVFVVELGCW